MHLTIPIVFGSLGTAFGYVPVFVSNSVLLVALSGYGSPQDRAAALAAGFSGYWVKPFEEAALRAALATIPARPDA